jgi:integrase
MKIAKRGVADIAEFIELTTLIKHLTLAKAWPYKSDIEEKTARDKALLAFLAETGLRISEALSVDRSQVKLNLDAEFIIVKDVKIMKRRKEHIVKDFPLPKTGVLKPLTKMVLTWYHWPTIKHKDKGPLFNLGRYRAWQLIRHMTGKWCHFFRSQRISFLVNKIRSTTAVAAMMGIKQSSTIDHYYKGGWNQYRDDLK